MKKIKLNLDEMAKAMSEKELKNVVGGWYKCGYDSMGNTMVCR